MELLKKTKGCTGLLGLTLIINSHIISKMMRKFLLLSLFFLSVNLYAGEVISRVDIKGNDIVSDSAIITKIKARAGQEYNDNIINRDIKNLYSIGFFETVEVDKQDLADGVAITFIVKEKSVLKKITLEGARFIRKEKIFEEIGIKEGSFVDDYKLKETVRKIKDYMMTKDFLRQKSLMN